jgi:hypothetical protein
MGHQSDPNAMDTTPDRIRGRIAEAEDFLLGRNQYKPQGRNEGGNPKRLNEGQRQALICYNCGKIRHFA